MPSCSQCACARRTRAFARMRVLPFARMHLLACSLLDASVPDIYDFQDQAITSSLSLNDLWSTPSTARSFLDCASTVIAPYK
eukprot:6188052-Pleurochrysis_carterae.AAC.4